MLANDFWTCQLTHDGAWISRKSPNNGHLSAFCTVHSNTPLKCSSSEPRESGAWITWQAHGAAPSLQLQLRVDGPSLLWNLNPVNVTERIVVHFPYLAQTFTRSAPDNLLFGPESFQDGQGRPIFRRSDWSLPVVSMAPDGETLTLLANHADDLLNSAGLVIEPTTPALSGEIFAHRGGWPAAFDLLRQRIRRRFNLAEYERPELAWYADQLVQHFTFLYGREIFNPHTAQFELDRFLDDMERDFGGVDGMLIWGVYPRIGVDERSQWDFYDDFPGGRDGLRAMARRARERGVRFFIPYKPWDRSAELHGRDAAPDAEQLAKLVADVEADGVFLDTMSAIDTTFRQSIDQARTGVVFCSEGRARGKAFETITGSWDQTGNRSHDQGNWSGKPETMPGVDLARFIFPEHRLFVINRHAVGDDRLRIIQRGFFGGTGWVVWQDIFGLVLSYLPEEAALLKKCSTLFRGQRTALASPTPTPLLPTLQAGVYCNEFPAQNKRLWTFYNETDQAVDAPLVQITPRVGTHFIDIWNDRAVTVDGDGRLCYMLAPRSLGAVVEYPELLTISDQRIAVKQTIPGAQIHVTQSGDEQASATDDFQIKQPVDASKQRVIVRLKVGAEVLDQLIIGE